MQCKPSPRAPGRPCGLPRPHPAPLPWVTALLDSVQGGLWCPRMQVHSHVRAHMHLPEKATRLHTHARRPDSPLGALTASRALTLPPTLVVALLDGVHQGRPPWRRMQKHFTSGVNAAARCQQGGAHGCGAPRGVLALLQGAALGDGHAMEPPHCRPDLALTLPSRERPRQSAQPPPPGPQSPRLGAARRPRRACTAQSPLAPCTGRER
jgi:hypothetical protein